MPATQTALGLLYYHGEGVSKDFNEAFKWFGKAAEQGDAEGQFRLGAMYANGEGVAKDYVTAYKWADLAFRNAYLDAVRLRSYLEKRMNQHQLDEALQLSQQLQPQFTTLPKNAP